jgi:hypothetical protein
LGLPESWVSAANTEQLQANSKKESNKIFCLGFTGSLKRIKHPILAAKQHSI